MPLTMLHVPPRRQGLDRQQIVQARNVIDPHWALTEIPPKTLINGGPIISRNGVVFVALLRRRSELRRRIRELFGCGRGRERERLLWPMDVGVEEERILGGVGEEED